MELPRQLRVKDSELIYNMDYDPGTLELIVTFVAGSSYLYQGISQKLFGHLCAAPSVGKAFNGYIRDKFSYAEYKYA